MQLGNTTQRWGAVAKLFHWLIVALVIVQFVLANLSHDLPSGAEKLALLTRHKSVGITILGLAVLRLLWRAVNAIPELPTNMSGFERALARGTHWALYGLLFAIPLSGWMMSSAKNFPVSWFGLVQLPDLVAPSEERFEMLHETHEILGIVLLVVALLHVLGALRHHFLKKDDVLRRMLPFARVR